MKLERWFIGILTAWILSLPWYYLFSHVMGQVLGSKTKAPPIAQYLIDFFETSSLGGVALLLMFVGTCVAWLAPFLLGPMFIFFLFKYSLQLVRPSEKAK